MRFWLPVKWSHFKWPSPGLASLNNKVLQSHWLSICNTPSTMLGPSIRYYLDQFPSLQGYGSRNSQSESSCRGSEETNLTRNHEAASLIPGPAQWVKALALPWTAGVGRRRSSDPMLLWLWCRPAAVASIRPLAWETPYAAGAALKSKKGKKKKQERKREIPSLWEKVLANDAIDKGLISQVNKQLIQLNNKTTTIQSKNGQKL